MWFSAPGNQFLLDEGWLMIWACSVILCSRYLVSIGGRGDNDLSLSCDHATRASLPSHLSCIKNFFNEISKVSYVGSDRKNPWNQTLGNFWDIAILIFCNVKIGLFLQILNLSFPVTQFYWFFGLNECSQKVLRY